MAARIERIFKNSETLPDGSANPNYVHDRPSFWMEYFVETENRFVTESEQATVWPSHGAADDAAAKLREEGKFGYVFAVSCEAAPPPPEYLRRPRKNPPRETKEEHEPGAHVKLFGYD